jgi:hypothetical protein
MKVIDINGEWVGLGYLKGYSYRIDYFSTPDSWNIGFEIVYRLIFYTDDTRLIEEFMTAFKKAFGLSDEHYEIEQELSVGSSVYWRVYWDREGFELNILKKCEDSLDKVAERNNTKVIVVEMAIIPRSLDTILQEVKMHKKLNSN